MPTGEMVMNKEKMNLNVLKSVNRYEDLPSNPSISDFTYIENLEVGVVFTSEGWMKL